MNAGLLRTVARQLRGQTEGAQPDADLLRRFIRGRDERAFEELVRRHGPLVWGVCRRTLGNRADAEDAFQATFLVLAKDPRAVRKPAALGCWLYGVARRVAHRMRGRAKPAPLAIEPAAADASDELTVREFLTALDDELARLPDRERGPLVLCFLQERTQDEAARQLGVSLSTLKRRLDAGRETLRARLTRRGVDLTAALAAAGIGGGVTVSASVVESTVGLAGGGAVASAGAITVAEGVLRTMTHTKLKAWAAGLVMAASAVGGTGYVALAAAGQGAGDGPGPGGGVAAKPDPSPPAAGDPQRATEPRVRAAAGEPDVALLDLEAKHLETIVADTQKALDAYAKQLKALSGTGGTTPFEEQGLIATIARLQRELDEYKYKLDVNRHLAKVAGQVRQTAPSAPDLKLLELDLRQAQAELDAARANYDFSAKSHERLRRLADTGTVGQREVLQAEREMVQARSAVAIADVKIEMAKHRLTVATDAAKGAPQAKPTAPGQPVAPAAMSPEVRKLREEALKAAREAFKLDYMYRAQGAAGRGPEEAGPVISDTYGRSRRIFELELLLSPADRLKATREHFDRMKVLDEYAAARARAGAARPHVALDAKVYRLEAEAWVKEAEAVGMPPGPNPPGSPRRPMLPAQFRGTVRDYDRESGIVLLDPGLDAGVQKDTVMSVYRTVGGKGKYLGKVTIVSADPKQAAGTFVPADTRVAPTPDDLPKAGDQLKPDE